MDARSGRDDGRQKGTPFGKAPCQHALGFPFARLARTAMGKAVRIAVSVALAIGTLPVVAYAEAGEGSGGGGAIAPTSVEQPEVTSEDAGGGRGHSGDSGGFPNAHNSGDAAGGNGGGNDNGNGGGNDNGGVDGDDGVDGERRASEGAAGDAGAAHADARDESDAGALDGAGKGDSDSDGDGEGDSASAGDGGQPAGEGGQPGSLFGEAARPSEGTRQPDSVLEPGNGNSLDQGAQPAAGETAGPLSLRTLSASKGGAKAGMAISKPQKAELRPGRAKRGSIVPSQTIIPDAGGRLPLAGCSVSGTVAGLEKRARQLYTSESGLNDTYGIWISNAKLTAKGNYRASIPGTIVLKWANTASDIAGNRLDLTISISDIEICSNDAKQQKSKRILVVSNTSRNGTGYLKLNSMMQAVDGGSGGRIGIKCHVDAKFTYAGTSRAADGRYLFCVTDLDQPDKTFNAASDQNYTGSYVESMQLVSGFNKKTFVQDNIGEQPDPGPSLLRVNTGAGTFAATQDNDYPNEFRAGFVASTTSGAFGFNWAGSNCATTIMSNYEDVVVRDRNTGLVEGGIVAKSVNEYGQAIGTADATKRTSGSWRKTRMPWKGAATYYFSAHEGYRVTNVNFIYDEWNGSAWVRTNHYKGALSSYTFSGEEMDRDYDIELSTVAVAPVSTTVTARKVLRASDKALAAGEFEFQLKDGGRVIGTATNDASGNVTFTTPAYTYPSGLGKHVYTIAEVKGSARNTTYDAHVATVTVDVTFDGNANRMNASTSFTGSSTFTNTFVKTGGLKLKKVDSSNGRPLSGAVFGIYDSSGALVKSVTTNKHGRASLADTELSAENKTYTLREIQAPKGYVLSGDTMTFTLTADGQVADFTGNPIGNEPDPTTVAIRVCKNLKGRKPAEGEFAFALMEGGRVLETLSNGADGFATFSEMQFTADDVGRTFQYEVHELAGSDAQVGYDDHYWTVDITVVNDTGKVSASAKYTRHPETAETLASLPSPNGLDDGAAPNPRAAVPQTVEDPAYLEEAVIDEGRQRAALATKEEIEGFFDGLGADVAQSIMPQSAFVPSFVEKAYADTGEFVGNAKVALIDTASGEGEDDVHGHGTAMAQAILAQNPNADIVYYQALDAHGQGTAGRVERAVRDATASGAHIINLSLTRYDDGSDDGVEAAVRDAVSRGVTVVASAGSGGYDAGRFSPGNVEGVVTVGALDERGNVRAGSNVGPAVDVYVEAGSTSEAAATVSGWLSRDGADVDALASGRSLPFKAKAGVGLGGLVADGREHFVEMPLHDVPDELKSELYGVAESTKDGSTKTFNSKYKFAARLGYTISSTDASTKGVFNLYIYCPSGSDSWNAAANRWQATLTGTGQTTYTVKNSGSISLDAGKKVKIGSKTWTWARGTSAATKTVKLTIKKLKDPNAGLESAASISVSVPALATYAISYNGNGATSGSTVGQTKYHGVNLTLNGNGYARTGYYFTGWNTASNGSGAGYAAGGTYSANAGATLYAQWHGNSYTVAYNGNGATSGSTANSGHTYGTASALRANGYAKSGYSFMGWATSQANANAGTVSYGNSASVSTLATSGTVTLYAVWKKTVTVSFNANGGSGSTASASGSFYHQNTSSSIRLTSNGFTAPSGYAFAGWATSAGNAAAGTVSYSNGQTVGVSNSMTLYAVWKRTVTFKSGVDKEKTTTADQYYPSAVSVPSGTAQIAGWDMAGWRNDNVASSAQYAATGSIRPSSATLYAVYSGTLTTVYAANGGAYETGGDYSGGASAFYNSADVLASNVALSGRAHPTMEGEEPLYWCELNDGTGEVLFEGDGLLDLFDPEWTTVTLYAIWEGSEAVFTNKFTPLSGVSVKKVDPDTGEGLAGATFRIRTAGAPGVDGTQREIDPIEITTGADGVASTGATALWGGGVYQIEELEAPQGYTIDGGVREFTALSEQGAVLDLGEWANEPVRATATIGFATTFCTLTGRDTSEPRAIDDGEFAFDLYDCNGELVETVRTARAENGSAELAFPEMTFKYADAGKTFAYQIRERDFGKPGVEYDGSAITVEVRVDAGRNDLSAHVVFFGEDLREQESAVFENRYTPSFDAAGYKASAADPASGEGTSSVPLGGAELTVFEIEGGMPSDSEVGMPDVFASREAFEGRFAFDERNQMYRYNAKELAEECGLRAVATVATAADGYGTTVGGQLVSGRAYAIVETKAPAGYLLAETPVVYVFDDFADNGAFSHMDYENGSESVTLHRDEAGNVVEGAEKEARSAYRYEVGSKAPSPGLVAVLFENEPNGLEMGGVQVTKADAESGEPLAGALFEVYDEAEFAASYDAWRAEAGFVGEEGADSASAQFMRAMKWVDDDGGLSGYFVEPVMTIESDGAGVAASTESSLQVGKTYRIVEVEAPDGYSLPAYDFDEPVAGSGNRVFHVDEEGRLQELDANGNAMAFEDARSVKEGAAQIVARKELVGAALVDGQFEFALYDENGEVAATGVNDADGYVEMGLRYGMSERGVHRYRLVEASSGDPGMKYDSHETPVTVSVVDEGGDRLSCEVSVDDARDLVYRNEVDDPSGAYGSVRALKLDMNDGGPVAGARFLLEGDNGYLAYLESGEDGIAATAPRALPLGSYALREVEAPKGYLLNTSWEARFAIEEDGQVVDLTEDPCEDAPDLAIALPLTGGPGTWALTALVVLAIACFLLRNAASARGMLGLGNALKRIGGRSASGG